MTSPAAAPLAHFPVLDHGFVELWNMMGTDQTIAASARVSLHRELASKVPIEWGPEVYFYGRREFAVRDPDGNLIAFSAETSDPPTCRE